VESKVTVEKHSKKQVTEPVFSVKLEDGLTVNTIYILQVGQWWQDKRGHYRFFATKTPSLIFETVGPHGYRVEEEDINYRPTWQWLQERVQISMSAAKSRLIGKTEAA
jgi:hypothetical protein